MKILLIILLIIIVVQWSLRRLMPYILLYIVKRMTNKQFTKTQQRTRKEGKINVTTTTSTKKKLDKNIGDYVEFEEINDI